MNKEEIIMNNEKCKYSALDLGTDHVPAQRKKCESGITLIALAISRKCVRYEERA